MVVPAGHGAIGAGGAGSCGWRWALAARQQHAHPLCGENGRACPYQGLMCGRQERDKGKRR
jgi:hypothetical protein